MVDRIVEIIHKVKINPEEASRLPITNTRNGVSSLADLIKDPDIEVSKDTSDWCKHRGMDRNFLFDISNGMTPDIVLRSPNLNQNRIIIEVKLTADLGHDPELCQMSRYFLHLLATTVQGAGGGRFRRAVLLAAPSAWFEVPKNKQWWKRFRSRYRGMAMMPRIDITLGEIRTDKLNNG